MNTPWDHHSDLTEERLQYVADLLTQVRHDAVSTYDVQAGDTPWGLGCRAYDRSRTTLIRKSESIPWLTITDSSLQLVFNIGNVPIRFYRGDPESPKTNTLACSFPELEQLNLAFPNQTADLLWRFAIETDATGYVRRVTFIGTDQNGNVHCSWIANKPAEVVELRPSTNDSAGVELPSPQVRIPKQIFQHTKSGKNKDDNN